MKQIAHLATIFLVLFSISNLYSQSKDSLPEIKKIKYRFSSTNLDSIKRLNNTLIWTKNNSVKNPYFSIYNQTSKNNDQYAFSTDKVQYVKSNVLTENYFRNNKIDSFNPIGASNLQSGVLLGVFNLFLKK
ncbi:hypothetical protein GKZ90_0013840 [Flavobacterium sp. MC2016-06]|jgi:hypothetical protein|uniref:hypothetical protein n=1 Tax=Flavobacterium sp. MC2016-06 TaxID=2676308 RepID=UPI0012BA7DAE|nr:hypothetical protein [Flavobacterium sp. MC2016-06]MBU3861751.1 hypothetical protein [Flavobacterium sp. MC2016-06]